MPVKDNSLVAQYIRALENPDSLGYDNGIWRAPGHPGIFDSRNRGFGVDVENNVAAIELTKDRPGKWLTEDEERNLRLSHIEENQRILDKWTPKILEEYPSEEKKAMALGLLYRGDGMKSILKNPSIRDAYFSGTAEDMQDAITDYYNKLGNPGLVKRADDSKKFFQSKKHTTKKEISPYIKKPDNPLTKYSYKPQVYKSNSGLFSEGGSLDNAWNSLSQKEKSDMIRVAIRNGITTLPEIKEAYNKFAKGGPMKNWTMQDEAGYRHWRQNLPKNLRDTNDNDYDMRAAYKAGAQPMWNDEDKAYHLQSRDPESGRIFKAAHHPTYLKALMEDARLGYYPTIDSNGNTYTETWEGNKYDEGGNLFGDGGKKSSKQPSASERAMSYLMSKGMSRTGASAIVGTLKAESSLDPTIHAKMKGDTGEGLAQWTGSRKKQFWATLESIEPGAQKRYGSISRVPFERQLDVVLAERPDVTRAISTAKDVGTATDIMLRGYENGGGTYNSMATKAQMNNIYGKWNNGYNNQMKTRLGFANSLLGTKFDPSSFDASQDFYAGIDAQIALPQAYNGSNDIDPETVYKAPVIDETLFQTPKVESPDEVVYNPQQERLDNMQKVNTMMGLVGIDNPYLGVIGGGTSGLLDAVGKIYS
jgi:hypothetical protein